MTAEQLHDAIGMLDEELLLPADRLRREGGAKKVIRRRRYLSAAACLAVLLGCALAWRAMGGRSAETTSAEAAVAMEAAPEPRIAAEDSAQEEAAEDSGIEEAAQGAADSGDNAMGGAAAGENGLDSQEEATAADSGQGENAPESSGQEGAAQEAASPENSGQGDTTGGTAAENTAPSCDTSTACGLSTAEKPFSLTVSANGESVTLSAGSYTWTVELEDGTSQTTTACGAAAWEADLEPISLSGDTLTLAWRVIPESVTVRAYTPGEETELPVTCTDGTLKLLEGDCIYSVTAAWPQGEAEYVFRVSR